MSKYDGLRFRIFALMASGKITSDELNKFIACLESGLLNHLDIVITKLEME